jgi:hypothetical protein
MLLCPFQARHRVFAEYAPAAYADHGWQAIVVGRIRPCVAEMSLAKSWDGVLAADSQCSSLLFHRWTLSFLSTRRF